MVAKISLEATDNTGPSFQQLVDHTHAAEKAARQLMASGDSLEETFANLRHEFELTEEQLQDIAFEAQNADGSMNKLEREAGALKEELAKLAPETEEFAETAGRLKGVEERLKAVKEAAGQAGQGMQQAGSASEKMVAVMFKLWALKEVFMKIAHGVQFLASEGNPAAEALVQKFSRLRDSLVKLSETEHVQHIMEGVAASVEVVEEGVSKTSEKTDSWTSSINSVSEALRGLQERNDREMTTFLERYGLIAEGSSDSLKHMQRERRERATGHDEIIRQAKDEADVRKQESDAEKLKADLSKSRADQDAVTWAKTIEDQEEVAALQKEELERMDALAKKGELTAEAQEDIKRHLIALEQRKAEIEQESEERSKAKLEREREERRQEAQEMEEYERDYEMQRIQMIQDEYKAKQEAAAKAEEIAKQESEHKLEVFKAYVEKLQNMADIKPGMGLEAFNQVAGVGDAQKELVRRRQADAEKKARESNAGVDTSTVEGRRFLNAQVQRARDEATQQAKRDIRSGKASDEVTGIQGELANKFIGNAESRGALSKAGAEALRKSIQEAVSAQKEGLSISKDKEGIAGFFSDIKKYNIAKQEAMPEKFGSAMHYDETSQAAKEARLKEKFGGISRDKLFAGMDYGEIGPDGKWSSEASRDRINEADRLGHPAALGPDYISIARSQARQSMGYDGKPLQASQDLAGASKDLSESQSELTKQTTEALKQAAQATASAKAVADAALAQTQQVTQYLQQLNKPNDRATAQRRQ